MGNYHTGTETETGQQKKDGVVAASGRGSAVADPQHVLGPLLRLRYLGTVDCRQSGTAGTDAAKSALSSPFWNRNGKQERKAVDITTALRGLIVGPCRKMKLDVGRLHLPRW